MTRANVLYIVLSLNETVEYFNSRNVVVYVGSILTTSCWIVPGTFEE
jgi:hypothetical protein